VIGRAFDKATVLRVAAALESAAQFRHLPSFAAGKASCFPTRKSVGDLRRRAQ
jgi:hypothetical protein